MKAQNKPPLKRSKTLPFGLWRFGKPVQRDQVAFAANVNGDGDFNVAVDKFLQGDSRSHPRTSTLDSNRLQDAGTDPLREHLPRDQREGASPHCEVQRQGQVRDRGVTAADLKVGRIVDLLSNEIANLELPPIIWMGEPQ